MQEQIPKYQINQQGFYEAINPLLIYGVAEDLKFGGVKLQDLMEYFKIPNMSFFWLEGQYLCYQYIKINLINEQIYINETRTNHKQTIDDNNIILLGNSSYKYIQNQEGQYLNRERKWQNQISNKIKTQGFKQIGNKTFILKEDHLQVVNEKGIMTTFKFPLEDVITNVFDISTYDGQQLISNIPQNIQYDSQCLLIRTNIVNPQYDVVLELGNKIDEIWGIDEYDPKREQAINTACSYMIQMCQLIKDKLNGKNSGLITMNINWKGLGFEVDMVNLDEFNKEFMLSKCYIEKYLGQSLGSRVQILKY